MRRGNLWVANNLLNTVSEYTSGQLATGGSLTPAVVLSGPALNRPQDIAFNVHGNLWVANTAVVHLGGTIVEYGASALGASGSPAPAQTLAPTGSAPPVITAVAFDNSGNLWYTDAENGLVAEFSASSIAGGGSPQPTVVIYLLRGEDSSRSAVTYGKGCVGCNAMAAGRAGAPVRGGCCHRCGAVRADADDASQGS